MIQVNIIHLVHLLVSLASLALMQNTIMFKVNVHHVQLVRLIFSLANQALTLVLLMSQQVNHHVNHHHNHHVNHHHNHQHNQHQCLLILNRLHHQVSFLSFTYSFIHYLLVSSSFRSISVFYKWQDVNIHDNQRVDGFCLSIYWCFL